MSLLVFPLRSPGRLVCSAAYVPVLRSRCAFAFLMSTDLVQFNSSRSAIGSLPPTLLRSSAFNDAHFHQTKGKPTSVGSMDHRTGL